MRKNQCQTNSSLLFHQKCPFIDIEIGLCLLQELPLFQTLYRFKSVETKDLIFSHRTFETEHFICIMFFFYLF